LVAETSPVELLSTTSSLEDSKPSINYDLILEDVSILGNCRVSGKCKIIGRSFGTGNKSS